MVQSQFKKNEISRISNFTTLVNTLDYCDFNLYTGLLKSSFKVAYNILDKISRFINEYLNLRIEGNIALYDIFLDIKSGYYKRIQDIRNASVHEKLVIFNSAFTDWDEKEDRYNIGSNTMFSQTISLFKLVKSAIIYLINFVNLEENKKISNNEVLRFPMYVDATQFL